MSNNNPFKAPATGLLNAATNAAGSVNVAGTIADILYGNPFQIKSQWYNNQTIYLDGYTFSNCRFDNCSIHVSTGNFKIDRCFFSNCQFYYAGNSLNVVKLYNITATEAKRLWPYLAPISNSDGTVSI